MSVNNNTSKLNLSLGSELGDIGKLGGSFPVTVIRYGRTPTQPISPAPLIRLIEPDLRSPPFVLNGGWVGDRVSWTGALY
jgi:hypothetical protein